MDYIQFDRERAPKRDTQIRVQERRTRWKFAPITVPRAFRRVVSRFVPAHQDVTQGRNFVCDVPNTNQHSSVRESRQREGAVLCHSRRNNTSNTPSRSCLHFSKPDGTRKSAYLSTSLLSGICYASPLASICRSYSVRRMWYYTYELIPSGTHTYR